MIKESCHTGIQLKKKPFTYSFQCSLLCDHAPFDYFLLSPECTRWPAGTYGLPKPVSGCPWSEGILWREGWRSQATFIIQTNNSRSPEFHLDGKVDSNEVKRSFCIKYRMTSDRNRPPWPKGGLQFVLMKIFAAQHVSSIYAHC